MKEMGTFKIDKNMCSNCREDENCPQEYSVNGNCLHIEKGLVIEQVPETWEDLQELCKGVKDVEITEEGYINVGFTYFTKEGDIFSYIQGVLMSSLSLPIARNVSVARQWQIIKSLKEMKDE